MVPDLLTADDREGLCRDPACRLHGDGEAGCLVVDVERRVRDRLDQGRAPHADADAPARGAETGTGPEPSATPADGEPESDRGGRPGAAGAPDEVPDEDAGVSHRGSASWEVAVSDRGRIHLSTSCAVNGAPLEQPTPGILVFERDSEAGNSLYLVTDGVGMPPEILPDEFLVETPLEDLCNNCTGHLRQKLPDDLADGAD